MVTQINETVIRDVVDIIMDLKDTDEIKGFTNRSKSFSSIAKASNNLTLVFPVPCSSSLSIETAAMVSKAIERKASTMLQLLFSSMQITNADNALDYIKNVHTNLKMNGTELSVDEFIDTMDKYVLTAESFIENTQEIRTMLEELRYISYTLPDSLNESSIGRYNVSINSNMNTLITEAPIINDNDKKMYKMGLDAGKTIGYKQGTAANKSQYEKIGIQKGIDQQRASMANVQTATGISKSLSDMERARVGNKKDLNGISKTQFDMATKRLVDNDVKKANELVPTIMAINFCTIDKAGDPITQTALIGVKAKLYPIDSQDIINRIIIKNKDHNGLLGFIKASTMEISFWKDFVFAIDKAKLDALSNSRRGSSSPMWKVLERRALKSKLRRSIGQVNDASAITTLVMSQEEVEFLRKEEGIDILNPNIARVILDAYNLMGIAVADETMDVVKFIFDTGDDIYETITFNNLEKDASDNSYRKMVNLMTKINR